jgi:RecJ-like exonuclease
MKQKVKKFLRKVGGRIEDAYYDLKYKIENWNECPACDGSGEVLIDRVEWYSITADCGICNGSGKIGIAKVVYYHFHRKERDELRD